MDASVTPVESELRSAKEMLSFLNQLTAQAERGAAIDYDKAFQTLAHTMQRLQCLTQGQVPQPPVTASATPAPHVSSFPFAEAHAEGNGGVVTSGPSVSAVYARTGGSGAVTELQRRRAQQALSELQLTETTLHRYQRKNQARSAGHAANVQTLLGNYGASRDGARNDFTELEHLSKEQESLQHTRRRMQQMNTESQAVLQALQSQTHRMSVTGNRIADMMESIGISNVTLLQIVRRNRVDAWLVYGGIVCLIVLMWYIF